MPEGPEVKITSDFLNNHFKMKLYGGYSCNIHILKPNILQVIKV